MTYGDGNDGDPLLVRRYLRRPDNVDGPAPSDATWPPSAPPPSTPPPSAPPPMSQRDRTAAALNWPTLEWFTQKQSPSSNERKPDWPPATPAGESPRPVTAPPAWSNAGPEYGWAAQDQPTEQFPAMPPANAPDSAATPPPNAPAHNRRRRTLVLTGAAVAVVVAIGGAGFAEFASDDGDQGTPIGLPASSDSNKNAGQPSAGTPASPTPSLSHGASPSPTPESAKNRRTPADGDPALPPVAPGLTPPVSASGFDPVPPGDPAALAPSPRDPAVLHPTPPDAGDPASTGAITGPGGLCLDLSGSRVQTATCDGGTNQQWTVGTDGTLRVSGRCADAGSSSVSVVTCGGASTSQWRTSGRTVVNVGTGGCLTDPVAGARAGTTVTVTTCTGGRTQLWALP
jgi:Ricin-type beta-trefoil lectin domain